MPSSNHSLSSPVMVPAEPDWWINYPSVTTGQLLALTDEQLAAVDPLAVNLIVAREIASLRELDLGEYQDTVNRWTTEFATSCLPNWQYAFEGDPDRYFGDVRFFSVAMLCHYLFENVGISYIEDQRESRPLHYTNPSDLFLNGLIDSLRGTCGNMPALAVAMGWRMGWPVSLACAGSHSFLRYDDGDVTFNMEVATSLKYGYWAPTDKEIILEKGFRQRRSPAAPKCGRCRPASDWPSFSVSALGITRTWVKWSGTVSGSVSRNRTICSPGGCSLPIASITPT